MARIFRLIVTVGLAAALLSMGLRVAPAFAGAESSFVSKINAERTSRGLAPLQVYWDLTDDARAHAKRMMERREIYHNPNLGSVTTGWKALGENVGVGPSVDLLHAAFMSTSQHRSNILGNYRYIGVGVSQDTDSNLWVDIIFMLGPDGLVDPPATTTTTTTTTQPPGTTTTTQPPGTTTTTQPPGTTTTTQPPGTTTTTQPPRTTTTTQGPVTTTTTTQPTSLSLYAPSAEEYAALSKDWIDPSLIESSGLIRL